MKLFTYGTLMSTHRNNERFLRHAKFLGNADLEGFALYDLEWYPGIKINPEHRVKGEVYEIDLETLTNIDHYEGEGHLYNRTVVNVNIQKFGICEAMTYVYNGSIEKRPLIGYEFLPWKGDEYHE